jgi:hypothetical protein
MSGGLFFLILQVVTLLASALTVWKLWKTGLFRRYRLFFWYFVFRVFNGVWPLLLNVKSAAYLTFYVASIPLNWFFYVGVILELCRLVLERHKGLYTLGRWALSIGLVISVGISVLSLLPHIKPSQRSKVLAYIMPTDRGLTLCLAIFLLLMLFLVSRYPVPLSLNVVVHTSLYTVFFLSNTLKVILYSVFGVKLYTAIDTALGLVSTACIFCWLYFLSPKGEESRVTMPRFGPEHEQRLLFQLDALNATLLKVSQK